MITGTPPILKTSFITYWPKGLTLPRCGTLSPMRLKSSSSSSTPASWAMARRWRTAFVEPPKAMTTAMALCSDSRVMMSRAVMPWRSMFTTASPDLRANIVRLRWMAGGAAEPGSDMPMASAAEAMVFAVYIPPQAPSPGQTARSMASTSFWDMVPARQAPTASKASMRVTSFSEPSSIFAVPGMIEPL